MWLIYGVLQLCGDRTVTYAYTFRFFGFLEILKINLGLGLFRARSIAALPRRVRGGGAGAESGAQNHSVEGDLP
jgi:hypothetical protein